MKVGDIRRQCAGLLDVEHTSSFIRNFMRPNPEVMHLRITQSLRIHFTRKRSCVVRPRTHATSRLLTMRAPDHQPRRQSLTLTVRYSVINPTAKRDCCSQTWISPLPRVCSHHATN